MSTHISTYLSELADRKDLPERLEVIRAVGPHRAGDVLTWREDLRGYQGRAGWMMLAGVARDLFGWSLRAARPIHTQQTFFAA